MIRTVSMLGLSVAVIITMGFLLRAFLRKLDDIERERWGALADADGKLNRPNRWTPPWKRRSKPGGTEKRP